MPKLNNYPNTIKVGYKSLNSSIKVKSIKNNYYAKNLNKILENRI